VLREGRCPKPTQCLLVLQVGNCTDCVGEVDGTLNTCELSSDSCISTQNDDARHFVAPWMYDGPREEAVELLVQVGWH
jgi:uncharacterized protein (DUF1499 family)